MKEKKHGPRVTSLSERMSIDERGFEPNSHREVRRRSFLRGVSAAAATLSASTLFAAEQDLNPNRDHRSLNRGDIAILRLLAAAEIIEADLWQQYAELGGITNGAQNNYQLALQFLDSDGSQYITSNTLDEVSHAVFINAYLESKGEEPVDFDRFRILPSSQASGAKDIGRLTNLTKLNVDTSWYIRYRSKTNPDFGAKFQQALKIVDRPAIPRTDGDFEDPDHIQVIANTAAFHFGFIEETGTSLYATLSQKVSSLEVLKITLGIGGDEIAHFLEWVDFAGNAVQGPPFSFANSQTPVTDEGLTFPDFNVSPGGELFQTNLIFPVPCEFISPNLPLCAVIRPTSPGQIDARGAIQGAVEDGLFIGQPKEFAQLLLRMADEADAARRQI
jgi:hypothetical protein